MAVAGLRKRLLASGRIPIWRVDAVARSIFREAQEARLPRVGGRVKGSSAAHTALCQAIMLELGALPGVIIGLNPSGRAKYVSERTGKTFHTPYGWPIATGGAPDIIAVVAPLGRAVCLEVKTGNATTTPEQRACLDALRAVGVRCAVVRSVAEARSALEAN